MPLSNAIRRMERLTVVRAVRDGLVSMVPVLTIGAFALILNTFPVTAYQKFINEFAGGLLSQLFNLANKATFGVLSIYMTVAVSRSYMKIKADLEASASAAVASALLCFFLLTGAYLDSYGTNQMGPKSMFLALLAGLGASSLFLWFDRLLRRRRRRIFSAGVDREFNRMFASLAPAVLVTLCFTAVTVALLRLSGEKSVHDLYIRLLNALFSYGGVGFWKGFFFVLLSSTLWFFGIHGSDALEGVMQNYFVPGLAANQAAVAAGQAPTAVLNKQFFDCFVLMGGCGSAICLLIALLVFSRSRARRGLGLAAAFPMLFNINELMVFGLPIIFNPIMLIPFLCVPLACYSIAYLALSAGLVPLITAEIEWTTPILLGGYQATGAAAGAILQLVNVVVGVLIYLPFVRLLDRESERTGKLDYEEFVRYFQANESRLQSVRLTEQADVHGEFAKALCADLKHDLSLNLKLYYQPQYHYDGRCIGVEALMRWQHPVYGILYPPLVVKLAEESNLLPTLEEQVLILALKDRPAVLKRFGKDVKLSVNVTGSTVITPRFLQFCHTLNEKEPFAGKNICLEVTEQAALAFTDETRSMLRELRSMGLLLAIDDFSMGQTSLHYLEDDLFDLIKLDGSLVRGLQTNANSREIVASITDLSQSLSLSVLAEYVETAEQREILHSIGCDRYQGYLYSPAVAL